MTVRRFSIFDLSDKDAPTWMLIDKNLETGRIDIIDIVQPCAVPHSHCAESSKYLTIDRGLND